MNEVRLEIVFANPLQIMEVSAPVSIRQILTIWYEEFAIIIEGDHAMYNLPADHTVSMQVAYVDAKGNPATIDNDVVWDSSDSSIISVQADGTDSTKCKVTPVGVGQAQVTATVDADIGEGERELVTLADISVIGGEAVAGTISPVGGANANLTVTPFDHRDFIYLMIAVAVVMVVLLLTQLLR